MTIIVCKCNICRRNGGPLAASAPEALLSALGDTAKARHGLVYSANDPSALGRVTRERLGISAHRIGA